MTNKRLGGGTPPHLKNGDFVVKDSGERKEFETGAVRDVSTGKGRFDLIPAYPLFRLAKLYEAGAIKYADRNWEKGIPTGRFLDSAFRHLMNYQDGDRSEDHLTAVAWNIFGLIWTQEQVRRGKLPESLLTLPEPVVDKNDPTGKTLGQIGCDIAFGGADPDEIVKRLNNG